MNSVLDRIEKTLKNMCDGSVKMEGVWYGACRAEKLPHWNYFVFRRRNSEKSPSSKMDMQTFYQINIVHEDFIPEGFVQDVINELSKKDESGTKLRVADDPIEYDYLFKGSTNMVVEIATITIFHPEKRS